MKRTKFAPVLLYNEVVEGYIGFTLSVCPSVGLSVCPSVPHPVSVRSVAPGQFWLDPFHIYTSYQATSEGVSHVKFLANFVNLNFWQFLSICNFDFVLFWLGIWCESLVWVIMGRRWVSQNAGVLVVLVMVYNLSDFKILFGEADYSYCKIVWHAGQRNCSRW